VPQTNIEGNSHEDEGNTNHDDERINGGNTHNINNSPPKDGDIPNQDKDEVNTHTMDNEEISIENG